MKTCPVCKAQCFDDMSICYGCMYHFPESTQKEGSLQKIDQNQEDTAEQFPEEPPAEVIDQVEAFNPDSREHPVQGKENLVAAQGNKSSDEEFADEKDGIDKEGSPQAMVVPLEECGLEISIIVHPIGKGA